MRAQPRRSVRRDHGRRPPHLSRRPGPRQCRLPSYSTVSDTLGRRPRPERRLPVRWPRHASVRCRAAAPRTRGPVGPAWRGDPQPGLRCRRRARRGRAIPRPGRPSPSGRLPHQRPGHTQRGPRSSQQEPVRRALPQSVRRRRPPQQHAAPDSRGRGRVCQRSSAVLLRANAHVPVLRQVLGIHADRDHQAPSAGHPRNRADRAYRCPARRDMARDLRSRGDVRVGRIGPVRRIADGETEPNGRGAQRC